jgi:hypothetical protein
MNVTKRRERGKGGKGRKASRKPQGTLREPTQHHCRDVFDRRGDSATRVFQPAKIEVSVPGVT